MTKINIIVALLLINSSCCSQGSEKNQFGTKGINHESIALEFMRSIENKEYGKCYDLVSAKYKSDLNFDDFKFRMEMLNNLAGDEKFLHYNTTYIGATAEVDLRKLSGEKVTENIMPEYDFTVESEINSSKKHKTIWLRFENENSDKIQVVNYSYHYNFREHGVSNIRLNPFMTGSFLLIIVDSEECFVDIRGGNNDTKKQLINHEGGFLVKTPIKSVFNVLNNDAAKKYKILIVGEKENYEEVLPILDLVRNSDYEFESYFVEVVQSVVTKYNARNPFPLN